MECFLFLNKIIFNWKSFFSSYKESRLRNEETMPLPKVRRDLIHVRLQGLAYTRSSNLVGQSWSTYITQFVIFSC